MQTSWNILLLASQNRLVSFPARKNMRSAATILRDSIPFQDAVSKAKSAFQTLRKSKIPHEETDASEQTAVSFSQLDLNNVVSEKQSDELTQASQASEESTPQSEPVQAFVAPTKRRRSVIEHPLRQVCLELAHVRSLQISLTHVFAQYQEHCQKASITETHRVQIRGAAKKARVKANSQSPL